MKDALVKTIYILCNSPQCLREISSGRMPGLHTKDLFTCNNAYTFFKTSGAHFNIWTDAIDILRHLTMPEKLSGDYHEHVQHIYHVYGLKMASGVMLHRPKNVSPVQKAGSSALNALAYIAFWRQYERIFLVGYTLNERENTLWETEILPYYSIKEIPGAQEDSFVFVLDRK